jgi:hypothetical protein
MSNTTDLTKYKHQAHLELCLVLVEEAYLELKKGHHDMVDAHLTDILETFDRGETAFEVVGCKNNIVQFPLP